MSEDELYKKIGEKIFEARIKANIKQEGLAESLELSRVSVVNIEKGRQRPSIFLLLKIAQLLKVDYTELIPLPQEIDNDSLEINNANIIASFELNYLATQSLNGFMKSIKPEI